jgi:hypothetical protein
MMNRVFLSVVIVMWLSSSAFAGLTVREKYAFVGDKLCNINGQLEFALTQSTGNIDVRDINGIGAKFNNSRTYKRVPGKWYDKDYQETAVFRREEKTIFISNESFFDTPGKYAIVVANMNISEKASLQIDYFTGKNILDDGSGLAFQVTCPQLRHLCRPVNLKIQYCNNTATRFVAVFSGLAASNVDIMGDIDYQLGYMSHVDAEDYVNLPGNARVLSIGDDIYRIEVDAKDLGEQVTGLRLSINDCNHKLYRTRAYKSCALQKKQPAVLVDNISSSAAVAGPGPDRKNASVQDAIAQTADKDTLGQAAASAKKPNLMRRFFLWLASIF